MEKLTESVGEMKVFQLGTKGQTPDTGTATKQRRGGGNKRSPTKRGSLKSPNLDGRNSRRTTRANDQKMAKKARHKKNHQKKLLTYLTEIDSIEANLRGILKKISK